MVLEEQPGKVSLVTVAGCHLPDVSGVPGLPSVPAGAGLLPQAEETHLLTDGHKDDMSAERRHVSWKTTFGQRTWRLE